MTDTLTQIRCRNCGSPIVGCAETVHSLGWVHVHTNTEACPPGATRGYMQRPDGPGRTYRRRGHLAQPET